MTVLVTGATGYIGSHVVLELFRNNYDVVLADNLVNSKESVISSISNIIGKGVKFYNVDLLNRMGIELIFKENKIKSVIHLAGYKSVPESISNPLKYYENNIGGLLNLCMTMAEYDVKNIIFSSSATVYGIKNKSPLIEDMGLSTTNPYGSTKMVGEKILEEVYNSDNSWNINIFRYFNPVGADKSGFIGEAPRDIPNNIMPIISRVAIGKMPKLYIFGKDYNTPDGTCIRDFIHITDLAKAHIKAIRKDKLLGFNIYNLGTGRGYSVLELVNTFQNVTGITIPYEFKDKRLGDVDICYADPRKALLELSWKAEYSLEQMCLDVWRWESKNKIH